MSKLSRRSFVKSLGAASLAPATLLAPAIAGAVDASTPAQPQPQPSSGEPLYMFFNADEAAFIEAACERLIPARRSGTGCTRCRCSELPRQAAGRRWGAGERLYRSGPWQQGTPSQGYQLPFTPAELFHNALRAIGIEFERQDRIQGPACRAAGRVSEIARSRRQGSRRCAVGRVLRSMLLEMTVEGYFSDPVYGGNRTWSRGR